MRITLTTAFLLVAWIGVAVAQPDANSVHDDRARDSAAGSCQPALAPVPVPSLQQRSGDGTGEASSRSDACGDAQRDASDAGERACDGPFRVAGCRCDQDERDPDDPDDDVWYCSASWRCDALPLRSCGALPCVHTV